MQTTLQKITEQLQKAGSSEASAEAKLILAKVLGKEPCEVTLCHDELTAAQEKRIKRMIARRKKHEPLSKILCEKGFYKYVFRDTKNVLSPRPDSEIMVEEMLKLGGFRALELGVGSGCILLSYLMGDDEAYGVGIDKSAKALRVAAKNAKALDLHGRLTLENKDWTDPKFAKSFNCWFHIVAANPPYIKTKDLAKLAPEVKDYDPLEALNGGEDGLDAYRQIAAVSQELVFEGGHLIFEIGQGQAEAVRQIVEAEKFIYVKTVKDLNNIERCIIFKKPIAKDKKECITAFNWGF